MPTIAAHGLHVTRAMRAVVIVLLASCGEPRLVKKPLPPLVAPEPRSQVEEIVVHDLGLAVGEHWIWDVQVRGFSIGRAELHVEEDAIESRFRTGTLASAVAHVEYELITRADRALARPESSMERVDIAGKQRQFTTRFAGTTAHSFDTALGAIRVWAAPAAQAGFLHVVHANQVFRIELAPPVVQQQRLRVEGRVVGPDADLALTLWLDAQRAPVRIEIRDGEDRVTAELIEQ